MDHDEKLAKVHVRFENGGGESMWAREIEGDLFALKNLPFFAFGLNLEDVVRAPSVGDVREVQNVVRPSGHRTLRLMFEEHVTQPDQQRYLDALRELGMSFERGTKRLVAVDVPPEAKYETMMAFLDRWELHGELVFETCEQRVAGSFDDGVLSDAA